MSSFGWLEIDGVGVRVSNGRVDVISLSDQVLRNLGLGSRDVLLERLGPPEGTTYEHGYAHLHYPSRHMMLMASPDDLTLQLRVYDEDPTRLGARDLYRILLDLAVLQQSGWELGPHGSWAPIRLRFEQATALARALGFESFPQVASGRFLAEQPPPGQAAVVERLCGGRPSEGDARWLVLVWHHLLEYRLKSVPLVEHDSHWMLGGHPLMRASIGLTRRTTEAIEGALGEVDDLLIAFIDPEARVIRLDELIERYQYPNVDPSQ